MDSRMCGANSFLWLLGIASTVLAEAGLAHHGFTNHFDPDQERAISGSVTDFRFINPHVTIHIDVQNDGEIEQWTVEMGGTSGLLANGRMSSDSLQPGDLVDVVGHPSRHTEFELRANRLILPDGRELTMRNPYAPVPFLQQKPTSEQ